MLCRCDNTGLVSLILLGCELRVLYHCTMCTRHSDLVSLGFYGFYAIPIFHILHLCTVERNHPAHVDNVRARVYVYECREAHVLIKQSRNGEVYGKLLSETRRLSQ